MRAGLHDGENAMNECTTMKDTQYLILRTVDGDDTLQLEEIPCVNAREMLALLAAGRRVVRTAWCGSTLEADVSLA
jgi:hypothetical protein